jgi:hypothetical protein
MIRPRASTNGRRERPTGKEVRKERLYSSDIIRDDIVKRIPWIDAVFSRPSA